MGERERERAVEVFQLERESEMMPPRSSFPFFSGGEQLYLPSKYYTGLYCKIPLAPLPPLVFGPELFRSSFQSFFLPDFCFVAGTKGSSATLPALICAPLSVETQ